MYLPDNFLAKVEVVSSNRIARAIFLDKNGGGSFP